MRGRFPRNFFFFSISLIFVRVSRSHLPPSLSMSVQSGGSDIGCWIAIRSSKTQKRSVLCCTASRRIRQKRIDSCRRHRRFPLPATAQWERVEFSRLVVIYRPQGQQMAFISAQHLLPTRTDSHVFTSCKQLTSITALPNQLTSSSSSSLIFISFIFTRRKQIKKERRQRR